MVVIAGLIFSPDPIRRAKSLTPFKPPKSGTTALPSSATAKIGGSCCLSVKLKPQNESRGKYAGTEFHEKFITLVVLYPRPSVSSNFFLPPRPNIQVRIFAVKIHKIVVKTMAK